MNRPGQVNNSTLMGKTVARKLSRRRRFGFTVVAIALPFVLLLLLEGALRLFGYGHSVSLFVKDPDNPGYYVMNPDASLIYFSDSANATRGNIERFAVHKSPGSLRIFVLGESTTAGYPYMHNVAFHRWLQYRLMHTYPDRDIEIVNVALTAVNSYTVLNFGKEVLDYQPDAVLVYTGHNEYYGALGVGSTSRIVGNRSLVEAMVFLRRFRLVQLLDATIRFIRGRSAAIDTKENLMQRMAEKQEIPFGSALFFNGVKQFQENMRDLCRIYSEHRTPLFLSTLVSNEKDQPPLISAPGSDTSVAAGQFKLGDSALHAGNMVLAKHAFCRASELDLLRFRAPDTMNGIIRRLCGEFSLDVHLVDTRGVFEAVSPGGILGKETLLEHVHPNIYGYALMSEAFYDVMKGAGMFRTMDVPARPAAGVSGGSTVAGWVTPVASAAATAALGVPVEMSMDSLLRQMPVTAVDSLFGAYQIMMLKTRWPFHESIPAGYVRGSSLEEELAGALAVGRISWLDAMDQLFKMALKTNDTKAALKAAEAVMLEHPENASYLAFCGRLSFEAGYPRNGVTYFKKLYRLAPTADNERSLSLALYKLKYGLR